MGEHDLDHLFDASIERLNRKTKAAPSPYNDQPLAADHFLLTRSWVYFRQRIKTIEDQWREILHSKEDQIKTFHKTVAELQNQLRDLEDANKAHEIFAEEVRKARISDHQLFRNDHQTLDEAWECEKEALERSVSDLSFKLERERKEGLKKDTLARAREEKLLTELDNLKREAAHFKERELDLHKQSEQKQLEKDEEIHSRDNKVELMRAEIDRRDQIIRELKSHLTQSHTETVKKADEANRLSSNLLAAQQEIDHLKTQLGMLQRDRDLIRERYTQEQAQWRELWERGRESWEKRSMLPNRVD